MVSRLKKTAFCYLVLSLVPTFSAAGAFDPPELHVTASPSQACTVRLHEVEKVFDYDVSPIGPEVAALVQGKQQGCRVVFWRIGTQETSVGWNAPAGFVPRALAWHPRADCLFVMGSQGKLYQVMRLEKGANGWREQLIHESRDELRRLVVGPRPFVVNADDIKEGLRSAYRLFLGMRNPNGTYRVVSITEHGKKFYQVVGPAETFTRFKNVEGFPSSLQSASALPMAFHPAGHGLIWEDERHSFRSSWYAGNRWGETMDPLKVAFKGGSVTYTPNGLALLHRHPSSQGIGLVMLATNKATRIATAMEFVATPSSVPDGAGIVGLTKSTAGYTLNYVPIALPLPDVINAWMFCHSDEETRLLENHGGLFQALDDNQLYELYHSETYNPCCRSSYDGTQPTRPYLVTTDIFWELFAAGYEGLMIVQERERAIPTFWKFVAAADLYYQGLSAPSRWKPVFRALVDLRSKDTRNQETARIRKAEGRLYSDALGVEVNYGELKPRGHYASSTEMQNYFKAFRYLTSVFATDPKRAEILGELAGLPKDVQNQALAWIACYQGFVAPSRSPLVWNGGTVGQTDRTRHRDPVPKLFPLAWGFDNEVLYSTVFHPHLPPAEQITGPSGDRMSPSGLDLAAALGSRLANLLLKTDYAKYPPLQQVVDNLRKRFTAGINVSGQSDSLYDRWISALALQLADDVKSPNGAKDDGIWRGKRLQTGLASWATLRHATVLVNERSDAQCGEGGFEEIEMRTPRGYVEPDPRTFAAIADLFDAAVKHVAHNILREQDTIRRPMEEQDIGLESLRQGIIRRFKRTAEKARLFQAIAEKEIRGDSLTSQEYEEILYVGRVAEHHFLVFKSLGSKDYALSLPDPMPKIVDVAGGDLGPLLMAAVGKPVEWDHVVPYFGRRQIVKGAAYSYYEFKSNRLLNDEDWRNMTESQARPAWIRPFFTNKPPKLGSPCPPGTLYSF